MTRLLSLWGPVAAGMALIFAGSAQSEVGVVGRIPDWMTHGAEYAALAVLVSRALAGGLLLPLSRGGMIATVVLCTTYGVSDEYHQSFVPRRDASAADVAKDCGGAVAGIWVQRLLARRRP